MISSTGFPFRQLQLAGTFGDFGVSFAGTVAGCYTRRGGPRLSVRGEPICADVRTIVPPVQRRPTKLRDSTDDRDVPPTAGRDFLQTEFHHDMTKMRLRYTQRCKSRG